MQVRGSRVYRGLGLRAFQLRFWNETLTALAFRGLGLGRFEAQLLAVKDGHSYHVVSEKPQERYERNQQ